MERDPRRNPGEASRLRKLPDLPPLGDLAPPLPPVDTADDTLDDPEDAVGWDDAAAVDVTAEAVDPSPLTGQAEEPHLIRRATAERPLRVGVIGVGMGAAVHIPALAHMPETQVIAVSARRTGHAIAVAARYQIPMVTAEWRQIINEPMVDAVVVAVPPHLHHQMVMAALEAGKHVLCEAPMAQNTAEARDMAKMAASRNIVAMVNHQLRFEPTRMKIHELIADGYIGTPQAVNLTAFRSTLADPYSRPFSWHSQLDRGGGMLGSIGSHEVDSLRWWLGEIDGVAGAAATMVDRRISADGTNMVRVDADDNFAFVLRFASGALGTLHVTMTSGVESGEEILISGSGGLLIAEGGGALLGAQKGQTELVEIPLPASDAAGLPQPTHPMLHPTYRLMQTWVEAIREGTPTPSPSFHDGAKVQEIVDGVRRSGTLGRWVDTSGRRFQTAVPRHFST